MLAIYTFVFSSMTTFFYPHLLSSFCRLSISQFLTIGASISFNELFSLLLWHFLLLFAPCLKLLFWCLSSQPESFFFLSCNWEIGELLLLIRIRKAISHISVHRHTHTSFSQLMAFTSTTSEKKLDLDLFSHCVPGFAWRTPLVCYIWWPLINM